MNNNSKLLFIFLLALSMPVLAKVIAEPDIEVPCSMTIDQVKNSIRNGLKSKRWIALNKKEGLIVGTIYVRSHRLSMTFVYDQRLIKVRYKDSEKLRYVEANGKKYIHKKVNNWIRNVEIGIIRRLSSQC